jgi:hypothetical protein
VRTESKLWMSLSATGVRSPVGSPYWLNREQAIAVVSSEIVTTWAAAVKTLGPLSSLHQKKKEHYRQCSMQGQLSVSTG